ncbi:SPOR domain-containing protein [Qipengyuania marisflavi]|nr:SPOR domain-containing protein [Qipengyuania marisflavi]
MSTETKAKNTRLVTLAITTALASTMLSGCNAKVAPSAAYSAAKAQVALEKGKSSQAVSHAEAAVLATPRDAYTRTLLANAYLESGRFLSAVTTFAEAIELGDTAPRTVISYALAQTALGDQSGALATLERWETSLDSADFGLAVALAGRPQQGVHVLGNALRSGQNTAKVRQNLAYTYALMGDWRSARLMAAEDVPADQVGARLAQWAAMIRPEQYLTRVANLLGVMPSADPGQPTMLALANHPAVEQLAAESAAQDYPAPQPVSDFAFAAELPAQSEAPAEYEAGDAALADAGLAQLTAVTAVSGTRFVSKEVVQSVPAPRTASRARVAPRVAGTVAQAFAPETEAAKQAGFEFVGGDHNVQLGSYFSMSDAQAAWKQFQKRYPELANAEKQITKARVNGKIYYRVAATGFAKSSARAMCSMVKGKGAGCIAYAASNPLPGTINKDVRVAAR